MKLNKDYLQFERDTMDRAILEKMVAEVLSGWCGRSHGKRIALEIANDIVNRAPNSYLFHKTSVAVWRETVGLITIEFPFLQE